MPGQDRQAEPHRREPRPRLDRRADSITTSPGYSGSRQTLPRMAALPSVNASTYSATVRCQGAVVDVVARRCRGGELGDEFLGALLTSGHLAGDASGVDDDLRRARRVRRRIAELLDDCGEQLRAHHGEADVREPVVLGVLGDGVRVDVGLDAEGDDCCLVAHRHRGLLRLGQLLPAVAAPRGEQLDEHRRADAIGEGERHTIDVGDLQALPGGRRRLARGRWRRWIRRAADGLHGAATGGSEESGGTEADDVARAPTTRAATAMAEISGRMVSSRTGFVAEGIADWSPSPRSWRLVARPDVGLQPRRHRGAGAPCLGDLVGGPLGVDPRRGPEVAHA